MRAVQALASTKITWATIVALALSSGSGGNAQAAEILARRDHTSRRHAVEAFLDRTAGGTHYSRPMMEFVRRLDRARIGREMLLRGLPDHLEVVTERGLHRYLAEVVSGTRELGWRRERVREQSHRWPSGIDTAEQAVDLFHWEVAGALANEVSDPAGEHFAYTAFLHLTRTMARLAEDKPEWDGLEGFAALNAPNIWHRFAEWGDDGSLVALFHAALAMPLEGGEYAAFVENPGRACAYEPLHLLGWTASSIVVDGKRSWTDIADAELQALLGGD